MREIPVTGIRHPLTDQHGDGFVITESRAPVIFLSRARINFLAMATAAGQNVVLVTDELSALTPAFAEVWRTGGAAWVVRAHGGGLREGFTGRRLESVGEVFTIESARDIDDIAVDYLRPTLVDSIELIAMLSVRHRAQVTTLLGGQAESLAELTSGGVPHSWGPYEPTGHPWDRGQLTELARHQMPADTLLVADAPGLTASMTVRRTSFGVEEITQASWTIGAPTTPAFERHRVAVQDYLAELAMTSLPLVGIVLARPGRGDLLIPPFLQSPPSPIALLVGPPAVRSFDLDVKKLQDEHQAIVVGRPRLPGLLFGLGTIGGEGWQRLDAVLEALGPENIAPILGLAPDQATGARAGTGRRQTSANGRGAAGQAGGDDAERP